MAYAHHNSSSCSSVESIRNLLVQAEDQTIEKIRTSNVKKVTVQGLHVLLDCQILFIMVFNDFLVKSENQTQVNTLPQQYTSSECSTITNLSPKIAITQFQCANIAQRIPPMIIYSKRDNILILINLYCAPEQVLDIIFLHIILQNVMLITRTLYFK